MNENTPPLSPARAAIRDAARRIISTLESQGYDVQVSTYPASRNVEVEVTFTDEEIRAYLGFENNPTNEGAREGAEVINTYWVDAAADLVDSIWTDTIAYHEDVDLSEWSARVQAKPVTADDVWFAFN